VTCALVFPGQGSQSVGMGKALAESYPAAREAFAEADEALRFPLSRLCFEGSEEDLRLTENTQPAILAVSVAAYRALAAQISHLAPAFMAGHSLGEYSALVASGSLAFADALRAVRERGLAMQAAVPHGAGAMAALLGMARSRVEQICQEASAGSGGLVVPANYNAPGQVVIASARAGVDRALALFRERGGKRALELPVSAPFHTALMEPAARRMAEVLRDIRVDTPKTPLINNADARVLAGREEIVPSLVRGVVSPVRWEESVEAMARAGVTAYIELGPGRVLAGLARRICHGAAAASFGEPADLPAVMSIIGGGRA
jgi:[acyl-carrier-protein] S-malonyltransferase